MTTARENLLPNRPGPADTADDRDLENEASNRPLPVTDEDPDVGLSQKGTGESAIIRRETEI